MKKCLQCEQVYDDETNFCLSDGTTLVAVPGSFTSGDETPTVYHRPPAPTISSRGPIIPPISAAAPPVRKSGTFLIAAAVGLFALIAGGAVVGLIIYALNSSQPNEPNVANVTNTGEKVNKNASPEQKSDSNGNLAQNLKQQQEKLEKERKKLEDERKALEAQKKDAAQTPQPSSATTAFIVDPPSNIRATPNGAVICIARTRGTVVNILGSTGISDNNGVWYYTDYCGRRGVIHSTQIRF